MDQNTIIEKEKKYIMQTYGRFPIIIDHGKGCYLYDINNKKYLDLIGGLATSSIGHGNEELANVLSEQSKKLINITNLFYTEPQIILAEKMVEISGLGQCFLCNSGSEANEAAIKLARKYTKRTEIISTEHAFHGRTMGALSATWKKKYRDYCEPLVPHFKHIPFNDIKSLERAISDKTAAFIVEPIQGESGIIVPYPDYLKNAYEICKNNGVVFIVDEIQTNLRTGKYFAYQHSGILPDIVTVAKGIANGVPVGVTIAKTEIAKAFEKGEQGTTFGGNSLCCAAANFVNGYIQKNKLVENAAKSSEYFFKRLKELKSKHPSIKEIRGKGLMIGIELNIEAKAVSDKAMGMGLLVNVCTDKTLRCLPSLIITKKEIDEAIAILDKALS